MHFESESRDSKKKSKFKFIIKLFPIFFSKLLFTLAQYITPDNQIYIVMIFTF